MSEPMFTKDELAARWGVSRWKVTQMIAAGDIDAVQLGERTTRIPEASVEAFEQAHRWGAQPRRESGPVTLVPAPLVQVLA